MSTRKDAFDTLVNFCQSHLNDAYGVTTGEMSPKGNPRAIIAYTATFCKARITDGKFAVYSPAKIVVEWQTANRTLPHRGKETFNDVTSALKFLDESFA